MRDDRPAVEIGRGLEVGRGKGEGVGPGDGRGDARAIPGDRAGVVALPGAAFDVDRIYVVGHAHAAPGEAAALPAAREPMVAGVERERPAGQRRASAGAFAERAFAGWGLRGGGCCGERDAGDEGGAAPPWRGS